MWNAVSWQMWRYSWNDAGNRTELGEGGVCVEVCGGSGIIWSSSGVWTVPAHVAIDRSGIDHKAMFETFLNRGMLQEATIYCLDKLRIDGLQNREFQTKVLQANLMNAPQVSDVILQQNIWHHYDESKIAQLCDGEVLFEHAYEDYTDLADV